jgi:hypothetical protein
MIRWFFQGFNPRGLGSGIAGRRTVQVVGA